MSAPDEPALVTVHRPMPEGFQHDTDPKLCPCKPYIFAANDPRTDERIAADIAVLWARPA